MLFCGANARGRSLKERRTSLIFLRKLAWICFAVLTAVFFAACSHDAANTSASAAGAASSPGVAQSTGSASSVSPSDAAPPAPQTGGFDGAKAYEHVAKLVGFGPHPSSSDGIHAAQNYIHSQLQSSGCAIDEDNFSADSPMGALQMKNIVAKIPGTGQGIIILMTHYDTKRVDNFVGAEDGGSSTGLLLEMARVLCGGKPQPNAVWIAFLDGEETQSQFDWLDTDSTYGSRELAARLAVSGDLKRVRAVILADMIGQKNLQIPRESDSTKWLTDLIWRTASRLGYKDTFVSREMQITDDHDPFLHRGVAAVDIIDLDGYQSLGYWHTTEDTLDKISARSLAIVGRVILESVNALQDKFR
jgi:glutaminyl-peptide cyclotransferase